MEKDWIEHDGKGMPVDGETLVKVRIRAGDAFDTKQAKYWHALMMSNSCWFHEPSEYDITHYQIVKED